MSVVPLPLAAGLTVPETVKVGIGATVKSMAATLAPLIVTVRLDGVKMKPVLDGVTVYEPLGSVLKENAPAPSAIAVALVGPVSVSVVPLPLAAGVTVPVIVTACAVKFTPVTFAPATVIAWAAGVNA